MTEFHAQLTAELQRARAYTDALFTMIRPDSLYERPVPERHRFIFYVGHLEAFDWNLIARNTLHLDSSHTSLDQLFAFGIDPPPGQLPRDQAADWPFVEEVHRYNADVRRRLDALMKTLPEQVVHVAIEHRLMHAETLSYILHRLDPERKLLPSMKLETAGPAPAHRMIEVAEGTATLGRSQTEGFRWDNECDAHRVRVPAFALSKYKVTNRQFLAFVRDGGPVPPFWVRHDNQWFWRGMGSDIPLPLEWPVYVTFEQAGAYARWTGRSLPTEAQFHRAAYGTPSGRERPYPWGDTPPDPKKGHFNFHGWDPVPVTATPDGDSAFGVSQLVGNGWEWTSTSFHPFEGFQTYAFYPGYSQPFFDGEHFVLKGGSAQTASRLLRRSFRNWFRRGYPYVYAGFRCVEN